MDLLKASGAGTASFAHQRPQLEAAGFYREAQGLTVSSLGIGSYLGEMDEATDKGYTSSVQSAIDAGINFIDTSLNYRHQRSERAIGEAVRGRKRDSLVVCTKAGYLVPGATPAEGLPDADVVGGMHCMAPAFLRDQLRRSQENLGLRTIDVFYLHNPETQLGFVTREEFLRRCRVAFEFLERAVSDAEIGFYGMATWNGFRIAESEKSFLSLSEVEGIATEVGGRDHRFRFVQVPFNLAMGEAWSRKNQAGQTLLEAARGKNITVIASASLLQSRLSRGLPDHLAGLFPGTATDAQRAIQFTRSAPGVCVALVGMSTPAHVSENAAIAGLPPLTAEQFAGLFQR